MGVRLSSGSGSVEVKNLAGSLNVNTGSGNVIVSGSPSGDWRIGTGSGNIDFWPGIGGFVLEGATGSGALINNSGIDANVSMDRRRLSGTFNGGGHAIHMSTGSGNIQIHHVLSPGDSDRNILSTTRALANSIPASQPSKNISIPVPAEPEVATVPNAQAAQDESQALQIVTLAIRRSFPPLGDPNLRIAVPAPNVAYTMRYDGLVDSDGISFESTVYIGDSWSAGPLQGNTRIDTLHYHVEQQPRFQMRFSDITEIDLLKNGVLGDPYIKLIDRGGQILSLSNLQRANELALAFHALCPNAKFEKKFHVVPH